MLYCYMGGGTLKPTNFKMSITGYKGYNMKKLITNCPNCGAPLQDGYCSYCNTKVRYANELEFNTLFDHGGIFNVEPVEMELKFKSRDGTVFIVPLFGKPENFDINYNCTDAVDMHGTVIQKFYSSPTIKFEMVGTIIQ